MKNKIKLIAMVTAFVVALVGCGKTSTAIKSESNSLELTNSNTQAEDESKLNVVATLFPYFDFVREIAGDKVELTMLVPTGVDTHSFEPTPANMIEVQNADVFIYNGGEMESWVPEVLGAVENPNQISDCMMDHVEAVVEEEVEGMEPEKEGEEAKGATNNETKEVEYDEHIWTSPVNAQKIVTEICTVLMEANPENAAYFQTNTNSYIKKLQELDTQFKEVVDNSNSKTVIFGDKFPLRYFADEYGLKYFAAFNGCSTETEPSVDTVAFLIDKIKEENVPVVYHIELNSGAIANTISEATGAKVLLFHSCHNVTKEDFDNGVTYLELMQNNVEALKEGLN